MMIETKLEGILWGFAGAGIVPGMMRVWQYFYWNSPKHKEEFEKRMENKRIEMGDELKTKVRNQAGSYAYRLGLLVTSVSVLVFSIINALEIMKNGTVFVVYLFGYLLFQIIAGIVIFNKLMKRY